MYMHIALCHHQWKFNENANTPQLHKWRPKLLCHQQWKFNKSVSSLDDWYRILLCHHQLEFNETVTTLCHYRSNFNKKGKTYQFDSMTSYLATV